MHLVIVPGHARGVFISAHGPQDSFGCSVIRLHVCVLPYTYFHFGSQVCTERAGPAIMSIFARMDRTVFHANTYPHFLHRQASLAQRIGCASLLSPTSPHKTPSVSELFRALACWGNKGIFLKAIHLTQVPLEELLDDLAGLHIDKGEENGAEADGHAHDTAAMAE